MAINIQFILSLRIFPLIPLIPLISKDQKYIICTMGDVRGDILQPQHGTEPAAVIANKIIKVRFFESSETIQKKENGPFCPVSDNSR